MQTLAEHHGCREKGLGPICLQERCWPGCYRTWRSRTSGYVNLSRRLLSYLSFGTQWQKKVVSGLPSEYHRSYSHRQDCQPRLPYFGNHVHILSFLCYQEPLMIKIFDQQAEVQELGKIREPYQRSQAGSPLESSPIPKLHKYGETGLERANRPSRLWSPLPSTDTATDDRLIYLPLGNGSWSAGRSSLRHQRSSFWPIFGKFPDCRHCGPTDLPVSWSLW